MKNLLKLFCVVLVMSSTVCAGSLSLTASNLGNGQVAIGYEVTSGSDGPFGLGLNVMLTNGATFSGVVSVSSYFPTYPGTIVIDIDGVVTDWGTPVSPSILPGSLGGIGTNGITLEMAAIMMNCLEVGYNGQDLNEDGLVDILDTMIFVDNWLLIDGGGIADFNMDAIVNMYDLAVFSGGGGPLNLSQLIVLQIDLNGAASTTLVVSPETTYRGGIVAGDGSCFMVTPLSIVIPEPASLFLLTLGGILLRRKK